MIIFLPWIFKNIVLELINVLFLHLLSFCCVDYEIPNFLHSLSPYEYIQAHQIFYQLRLFAQTFPRPSVLPHGDRFPAHLGMADIRNLLHLIPDWPLPLFPTGLPCCLDLTCSSLWFSNTFPLLHLVSILRKGTCKVKYWNSKYLKKIPWRRACQPTPVFLPGEFYGQRIWWATVHGVSKSWTRLSD